MRFNIFHSQLHKDYIRDFDRVKDFYEYSPQEEYFSRRLGKISESPHRALLSEILKEYNTGLGSPAAVMDNIDLLARKETKVIIGGQQAGLFSGPLMTILKALEIINRAEQASRKTGVPVVPVFWVPGEDHDFAEVNHCWVINSKNQPEKIKIDAPFRTRPISLIPRKKVFLQAIKALESKTSPGRFKDKYLNLLHETGEKSETLGEWFARIMVRLFGEHGLILFDPTVPGAEKLKKRFISRFKDRSEGFYREVLKKEKELARAGYHVQVKKDNQHTNLFVIIGGERRPVFKEGNRFKSRGGDLDLSKEEFWKKLGEEPFSFSPDALLRPLYQDFVFPVLGSVNGPGELAYQAQLKSGYQALDLEQPPLFLRPSLTIVEEGLLKYLDRWEITPREIFEDGEKTLERIICEKTGVDLNSAFSRHREEIKRIYGDLVITLKEVHPNLEKLGEKNLERVLKEIYYLQKRAGDFHREKERMICNQFFKVQNHLFPGNRTQERVLNIFPFLMNYGPELLVFLKTGLTQLDGEHGFLTTDGRWK